MSAVNMYQYLRKAFSVIHHKLPFHLLNMKHFTKQTMVSTDIKMDAEHFIIYLVYISSRIHLYIHTQRKQP